MTNEQILEVSEEVRRYAWQAGEGRSAELLRKANALRAAAWGEEELSPELEAFAAGWKRNFM